MKDKSLSVQDSNRNNPKLVAYYQNLADIIGIFWQFHKERIQTGNIEFALVRDYERQSVTPFNIQNKINQWRAYDNFHTHKIIEDFSDAVKTTMQASWQQFLKGLGVYYIKDILHDVTIPDAQRRFFTTYTKELALATDIQVKQYARAHMRDDRSLSAVGDAGITTGSEATVQLCAVFGEDFKPASAIQLSKVKQDNAEIARREIGLPDRFDPSSPGNYSLLDNSFLGLKKDRLRELGLGFTLGCPASMKISSTAEKFLRSKEVTLGNKTMLEEFATIMPEQFKRYVSEWYAGLSPEQQKTFVDPEHRKILSGETRRTAISGISGCPYGKER